MKTKSAADLLREEADRLGGVLKSKPIERDLRWAYSVAAAWLDCRNDPASISRWKEIQPNNKNDTQRTKPTNRGSAKAGS